MRKAMLKMKKYFLFTFLCLFALEGSAVIEKYGITSVKLSTISSGLPGTKPVYTCYDNKAIASLPFTGYTSSPFVLNTDFKFKYIRNQVKVSIDRSFIRLFTVDKSIRVRVKIDAWDAQNVQIVNAQYVDLDLKFNPSVNAIEDEVAIYQFQNAVVVKATIDDILNFNNVSIASTFTTVNYPEVKLDMEIEMDRVYNLNLSSSSTVAFKNSVQPVQPMLAPSPVNCLTDFYDIQWNNIVGAEAWELEWQFVEDDFNPATNTATIDFRYNATRLRINGFSTTSPTFRIPGAFEQGLLVYRVRPIGRDMSSYTEIYGQWSMDDVTTNFNLIAPLASNTYPVMNYNVNLNWVKTIVYSADAKSHSGIIYSDGVMRNRQNITMNNEENVPVVSQVIYDMLGRPAITVLPTPALDGNSKQCFRPRFNKNINNEEYNFRNFDLTLDPSCPGSLVIEQMSSSSGAAKYYSGSGYNSSMATWQAYTPDAEGYPFIQTEFAPDNSGRVLRQSAAGATHRLSGVDQTFNTINGKEIKKYYGKPFQEQLDMMFGAEAGNADLYKRNVVVDQNGQSQVSYLDAQGRVVATSLAGDPLKAASLSALPSSSQYFDFKVTSFANNTNGKSKIIEHTLIVTDAGIHSFEYTVDARAFSPECTPAGICYDCVYDMELSLVDECGINLIPTEKQRLMLGNIQPFDLTCNAVSFSLAPGTTLDIMLQPGRYTLRKELRVNSDALLYYLDQAWNNNTCRKTLADFVNEEKEAMAIQNQCEYTCTECKDELSSMNARKLILTEKGSGRTEAENAELSQLVTDIAKQEDFCQQLCEESTPCDVLLETILADVRPGGQYAPTLNFDETTGVLSANITDSKSVLNESNTLLSGCTTRNWRYPLNPGINGSSTNDYYTKEGQIALIPVANGYPEIQPGKSYYNSNGAVFSGSSVAIKYIKPQDLKYVDDFIRYYFNNPSWAHSLKFYHPEYCYYAKCKYIESTYEYNNKLMLEDNAQEAMKKGYFNPVNNSDLLYNTSGNQNPYASQEVSGMVERDPLYRTPLNIGDFGTSGLSWFQNHLLDYVSTSTVHKSIWELYIDMKSSSNLDVSDESCAGDQHWPFLRALYIAAKDDVLRDYYKSSSNCSVLSISCPGCSGNNCMGDVVIPSGKLRRFPLDATSLSGDPLNLSDQDSEDHESGESYVESEIADYCEEKCESYKEYWIKQMEQCNLYTSLTSTQKAALIEDLKAVCIGGCDEDNLFGARNIAPYRLVDLPAGSPKDFHEVLGKYLGPGVWLNPGVCDELVLEWPKDYGHDFTAYDGPYADTCACKKKDYAKSNPNCSNPSIPEPLDDCACEIKNDELRQSVLMKKEIPDNLKCQNCVDCRQVNIAYSEFRKRYGATVVSGMSDKLFEELLEKWMNFELGFNLSYSEYLNFAGQCKNVSVAVDRTVWNDFNTVRWVYDEVKNNENQLRLDSTNNYWLVLNNFSKPSDALPSSNTLKSESSYDLIASESDGIFEAANLQSADADKLACHCEKLLTAKWYKDNENPEGLSEVDMMKKVFGSSIYNDQAEFDKNYNVCCNAFKMNVPPDPNCSESGYKPGDKFSNAQKAYFDNHVLAPNTNSLFIHNGANDFARMYDNACNTPLTSDNKREYPDNCACDKLLAAKAAYALAYPGKYGVNPPPPGVPTFETYIYNQYGVSGPDLVSVADLCEKSWKSGAGENAAGAPNPWTGIGANWSKVSKENLFQYSTDDGNYVPKGLQCITPPATPDPCRSFPPDCYTLKAVLKDFLAVNTLPAGMTLGNPYGPGDPNFSSYNFYAAWEKFYEAFVNNNYSSTPDPNITAFFDAFAAFANAHALVKMPCSTNRTFSASELMQRFKSCLPPPCKPSCEDFSQLFNGYLAQQAAMYDLPTGLTATSSLLDFYIGAKNNYYNDPVWNALVYNFVQNANYLIKKRCPKTNMDLEYDFTQVWHMMWYCFNWPPPPDLPEEPIVTPKCTSCYTINDTYLEDFRMFLNQICFGKNYYYSKNWNILNFDDWKLINGSRNITSFYTSSLYTGGTSSGTLKYHINQNTFAVPFMDVKVDDANGFKFGFTFEFPSAEGYYNYGYIVEVLKVTPLGRINCGLPRGYEAEVKIMIPRDYPGAFSTKTIMMTGIFTHGPGYASNATCLDTCVRLCNKPQISEPVAEENQCEKVLLRVAYSNALMKYNEYKNNFNRSFENNYVAHCLGVGENFSMRMTQREYHYTLFYYDQADNIIKTVPPEGVDFTYTGLSGSQRNLFIQERIDYTKTYRVGAVTNPGMIKPKIYHTMMTHYKYNTLNQPVWTSSPDQGIAKCWYDALGRSVVSQNAKQSSANEYGYILFDAFGRSIETGKKTTTSGMTASIAASSGLLSTFMSSGTNSELTRTVYDSYDASDPVNSQFTGTRSYLRQRVSAIFYYRNSAPVSPAYAGQQSTAATYFSYDVHGNPDQCVNYYPVLEALGQQYKHIKYDYNLRGGLLNEVHYQNGKPDQFHHRYTYDANDRLSKTETSRDNWNFVLDEKLFYYLHGMIARQELGSTDQKVQGTDWAFNINGLLKAINGPSLISGYDMGKDGDLTSSTNPNKAIARDASAIFLRYYANDYSPVGGSGFNFSPTFQTGSMTSAMNNLYNGKISYIQTSLPDAPSFFNTGSYSNTTIGKAYKYDQLYRIVEQKVFNNFSASTNYWPNSGLTGTGVYYESFSYDAAGNILTLNRNGHLTSNLAMDNLTYRYGNVSDVNNKIDMYSDVTNTLRATVYPKRNNRLYHVDDNVAASVYTSDNDDQGTFSSTYSTLNTNNNYSYDALGNLIKDTKEEIASIEYNNSGKIVKVTRTTGSIKSDIENIYDAYGRRIVKIIKPRTTSGVKPQRDWTTVLYVNDMSGNLLAQYDLTYEELTANQKVKEKCLLKELQIKGSGRTGIYKEETLLASKEYTISGYAADGTFVNKAEVSGTLVTNNLPNLPFVNVLYKGKKHYELNNHVGSVMATLSDRRQAVDQNGDWTIDYYVPDILSVIDYYSFGSSMPGIGTGPMPNKIYDVSEEFNSGIGSFTAGVGAITVTNPTGTKLHIEAAWTTRPLARRSVNLINGRRYTLKVDIAGFSVVSGYSHTVRVRILLPGNTLNYNYTVAGLQTINFTSNTTGLVNIEISSQITGTGPYTISPYIDIDSFKINWDTRNYRFAYQGSEYENEMITYTTENRMLDARLGRWFSADPMSAYFPGQSPYCSMDNDPISNNDVLGLAATEPPGDEEARSGPTFPGVTIRSDGTWYLTNNPSVNSSHLYGYRYDAEDLRIRNEILARGGVLANGLLSAERLGRYGSLKGQGYYGSDFAKSWTEGHQTRVKVDILDAVQTVLDVAGMVPVVGEIADGLNAAIYAARGDYATAAISLTATVPLIGTGATVGKLLSKATKKGVSLAGDAAKYADEAVDVAKGGTTVIGEGMARVEAAASKIPGAKILNDMPKFTGTADQITSQMMQYNRQWILNEMRSGRTILDIGRDLNRSNPSIFYQMEQNMLKNYQILHPGSLNIIKP